MQRLGLCSEPFMHSSQPPCRLDLGEVQIDCSLKATADTRPMENEGSLRKQIRSGATCIGFPSSIEDRFPNAGACEGERSQCLVSRAGVMSRFPVLTRARRIRGVRASKVLMFS